MKLDDIGCWTLIVFPSTPLPKPLDNSEALRMALRNSTVQLRGWDFPHIGPNNEHQKTFNIDDGIRSRCYWSGHPEGTTAFFDGTFIHRKAINEELIPEWRHDGIGPWLDFTNTIWSIYEFFLFISRYYALLEHNGSINLAIKLAPLENRLLSTGDFSIFLPFGMSSQVDAFNYHVVLSEQQWKSGFQGCAVDCTRKLFNLFNFDNIDPKIIIGWQERLAQRKY
jgi:hypothetical protein